MTSGAVTFARYGYPPNVLGFCGPDDAPSVRGYADAGVDDGGLAVLARQFTGAWPYLELIAGANGVADPLDATVVEAYWVGNPLLERIPGTLFAAHLDERFAGRAATAGVSELATLAVLGARPHHNFHVFAVYPWIGLLRSGVVEEPLRVMDSCRIAWGTVVSVHHGVAEISSKPLVWDGFRLRLGAPRMRQALVSSAVAVGETVSLHWEWACEVLTPARQRALRHYTSMLLRLLGSKAPTAPGLVPITGIPCAA